MLLSALCHENRKNALTAFDIDGDHKIDNYRLLKMHVNMKLQAKYFRIYMCVLSSRGVKHSAALCVVL